MFLVDDQLGACDDTLSLEIFIRWAQTTEPALNLMNGPSPDTDMGRRGSRSKFGHSESSRIDLMPDLHLQNLIDRLILEHTMLKASTRHMMFALSFLCTLVWLILSSNDIPEVSSFRSSLVELVRTTAAISSPVDSNPGLILSRTVSSVFTVPMWAVWVSRRSAILCSEGQLSSEASLMLPPRIQSQVQDWLNFSLCLTEYERSLLSGTEYICYSTEAVAVSTECLVAPDSILSEPALMLPVWVNRSYAISAVPFLASLNFLGLLPIDSMAAFAVIEIGFLTSPVLVSVNIYRREKDMQVPLAIVALTLCSVALLLDVKNLVKKSILSRKFRWVKVYTLFNTLALGTIVSIRWIFHAIFVANFLPFLDSFFDQTTESKLQTLQLAVDLRFWRNGVDTLTFVLLFSASTRLLRILSAHPKTSILSDILTVMKFDIFVWLLRLSAVFALTVTLFVAATSSNPVQVIHWLVQVPFGVWQFEKQNHVLLIIFGLAVFHSLLQVLQAAVHRSFSSVATRQRTVANELHEDLWLALRRLVARRSGRFRWPHRLVLLTALELIRDSLPPRARNRVSFHQVRTELERIRVQGSKIISDPIPAFTDSFSQSQQHRSKLVLLHAQELQFDTTSLEEVWTWYYDRFGVGFLYPGESPPVPISTILADLETRAQRRVTCTPLPDVSEIHRRTALINTFLNPR